MDPMAMRQHSSTTRVQTNGTETLVKPVESDAIVEAVHDSLETRDCNKVVREMLTFFFNCEFDPCPMARLDRLRPHSIGFGRSIVHGRGVSSHQVLQ
jgi:hypothetical protein